VKSSGTSASILRFGAFEADLHARELRKHGLKLKLQDQPFQVLMMLLDRPGEMVTREELRQKLWPAETFVGFDHGLNNAVNRLRETLSDSADNPRFIETLPRRGYRFTAPVTVAPIQPIGFPGEQPAPSALAEEASSDSTPGGETSRPARANKVRPPLQKPIKLAALAVVLIALAGIGWSVWHRVHVRPDSTLLHIHSLAVLPLSNLSGDAEQEYFVDGMTAQLITDLAKIGSLRVVSQTSAVRYKGTHKPAAQIARELDVDALVEGEVLRSENQVRVNVQLIEAATDRHIWAETYRRDLRDVLDFYRGK
jgi:TolB-like protein/DNA-binding winged helix-turn-helix (wHTH) protein